MNPTNASIIYFSDTRPSFRASRLVWWGLSVIEVLLFIRLFLELSGTAPASDLFLTIHKITNFLVYPFTIMLGSNPGEGAFALTIAAVIVAYFLLALGVAKVFGVMRPARSRIERARALSRRKYSR